MEKLDTALCQWIVLIISIFTFPYLHTFYKTNNIKTKSSTKVKTCIQIWHNKGTDKCSTLDPHRA